MSESIPNQKAPILPRKVWGRKKYCWRICPYAVNAVDTRIPDVEKSVHTVTSGAMELCIRTRDQSGFKCTDPNCSFFLGTATTSITLTTKSFTISGGEYVRNFKQELQTPCSGVQFFEY